MDEYHIYASSSDSETTFPSNTAADFIVVLPEELKLVGKWKLTLTELCVSIADNSDCKVVDVYIDCIHPSIVKGSFLPILRRIQVDVRRKGEFEFSSNHFNVVNKQKLDKIRFEIRDDSGALVQMSEDSVTRCALHLKRSD